MNQTISLKTLKEVEGNNRSTVVKHQLKAKPLIILSLEILLALPLGLILAHFQIGGLAWIFVGIVSGTVVLQSYRIFYNYLPKPNRTARKIGMTLVGLNVGFSIVHGNLTNVTSYIPTFTFLTCFLLLCGLFIGYFYSRLSKTNLLTAMLATVPGGVGPMSAIAADYGRNVALVALVQALRVTTVVFLIPSFARISSGTYLNSPALSIKGVLLSLDTADLGLLLLTLILGGLGMYLTSTYKIPAGDFFCAIVVGFTFNPMLNSLSLVGNVNFNPPPLMNLVGQMLLGITIGEYWGDKSILEKKTIAYSFLSVAMTLVAGAITAILAMQLTAWDWLTCMLVTAPGGSAEMILVSLALDHNVEIVTTGHLIRLIAINSSLPLWVFLFRRLEGKLSEPVEDLPNNGNMYN
jgi:membrane AbrB-like protein